MRYEIGYEMGFEMGYEMSGGGEVSLHICDCLGAPLLRLGYLLVPPPHLFIQLHHSRISRRVGLRGELEGGKGRLGVSKNRTVRQQRRVALFY